jgi:hypothetical protein
VRSSPGHVTKITVVTSRNAEVAVVNRATRFCTRVFARGAVHQGPDGLREEACGLEHRHHGHLAEQEETPGRPTHALEGDQVERVR